VKNAVIRVIFSALLAMVALPASAADMWQTFMRIGAKAEAQHNLIMSEVMYTRAMEHAEVFGEKDPRFIETAMKLADLRARLNEVDLASPIYQRLISIAERRPEFAQKISPAINNFSSLLARTQHTQTAELVHQLFLVMHSEAEPAVQVGASGSSL
jgi:hypothetical protein